MIIQGSIIAAFKGDTMSLDYSSGSISDLFPGDQIS